MSALLPSEITREYFLTAGDTDAQGRMPMWLIVSRIIEAAINHANILGVGYDDLIKYGIGWVLTRLTIEVNSYLGINQPYKVTTWIEGYNRLFSDRCFEFTDAEGNVLIQARSMWVAIDMQQRTTADLSQLDTSRFIVSDRRSPVGRQGKQRPLGDDAVSQDYTFKFCDIDFNRHVNTVQYVRHLLNQWSLDHYDSNEIAKFEIAFHNECHYGESVKIRHVDTSDSRSLSEIVDSQGRHAVTNAITWRERVSK